MRAKWWISVLAVLGVLVHAAAIARHTTSHAGAALQYHTLLADLAQLCRSDAKTDAAAGPELPFIPPPTDALSCQVCCGLGSTVASLAPEGASLVVPAPAAVALQLVSYCAPQSRFAACPPARGPPALA
jgi:hypothetical protein